MTFGHLESQLVNFAQTSKFSFSDMTSSILQDLSKILIRMGMMNMVGVVEGLRTSGRLPGYSSGGVVGAPPKFIPNIPSSQQGQQKSGDIVIHQTIHYQGDKGEEDGKNAGREFAKGFKAEVRKILVDEKRSGGILSR